MLLRLLVSIGLFACYPWISQAEGPVWPAKTGPNFNGNASADMSDALPISWDVAEAKNVGWMTDLQFSGHSTPIIADGRIWLTSATEDGRQQYIDCFDAASGKQLHHHLLFENESPEPLGNPVNNYAAPSMVACEDAVYAHFGTYGTARIDPESMEISWQRRDIHARHFRGPGSSPVLVDDLLVLTFDGIDQQFLIALDANTGKTVWRTDRSTDYGDLGDDGEPLRDGDLRKAYGTPAIATVDGQKQIISVGSRAAFGYEAKTGVEIWTLRHEDYNAAAQPIIHEDLAILHTGSRGANLFGIRLSRELTGDITDSDAIIWNHTRGNARLSYPVLCADMVVWITDAGVASAVDVMTGESLWNKRIGGNFVASPLVVGDRVYFFSAGGEAFTCLAGRDGLQVIAENMLPAGVTASPAASSDGLIVRTKDQLLKLTN